MNDFLAERNALIASAEDGALAARTLSALTDEAVRGLSRAASHRPPGRWAVVALGGWGSGALLPASDLDVLVLSDAPDRLLKPFVEGLLYPLWDSGLEVGHQVRSPAQQRKAMKSDLATCTAALTARPLAGDADWASAVIARAVADTAKRRTRVLADLQARSRPGSPYLLQPDLKDGAGGRRDYDELIWTAVILSGRTGEGLAPLVEAGVLSPGEESAVTDAARVIASARWDIQRTGRAHSVMELDVADEVRAGAQAVQEAIATTANVLLRVRVRLEGRAVDDGPLSFAELIGRLEQGRDADGDLCGAAWAGRLDHLFAGYSSLLTLRRPGLSHELTVGAHSIRAACEVAGIAAEATGALATSYRAVKDRPGLLVACLAHDVGKVNGGSEHARHGAEPAHDAALACGLRPSRAQDVADLVRLHLTLVRTAFTEDLDDEDTVLRAAARIGRRDLVAPLHVLTVVDSLATGPGAWGAWQSSLVSALVARIDAALSPDVDGAGLASLGEAVRDGALGLLRADASDDAARFIRAAPIRYLAGRTPEEVVKHAELVMGFADAGTPARVAVGPATIPGAYTVAVAASDRPELFARIAGAISLAGLDILAADAHGGHDGIALDVFTVHSATRATPSADTWAQLDRYLAAALRDRLELETRLAQRRLHYPATASGATRIDIDPTPAYGASIRVETPDRVGLLYDLGRAITGSGLDIRWAKAVTAEGIARDTFSVVGPDGQTPTDPGVLGHVAMAIRDRI